MSKDDKTKQKTKKDLKFQNERKLPKKTYKIYISVSTYIREHYLWRTRKKDMSLKSGAYH
jgi:hypothetical protein